MADEWPGQRLHQYAIYDRHDAMLDILQGEERKNINARDTWGRTPVYTAVSNNSIKCLEVLLHHGADPSTADGERVQKMTPLHQALVDGKTDAVKLLLQYGADLNHVDETGMSPDNLARSIGSKEYIEIFEQEHNRRKQNALKVVEELCTACEDGDLDQVTDILTVPPPAGLELANMDVGDHGRTPLTVAVLMGNPEIVRLILGTVKELKPHPSAIHLACEAMQPESVRLLLQKFPECCKFKDDLNQLPLHIACKTGSLDIVKLLLEWDYPDYTCQSVHDHQKHIQYKQAFDINELSSEGKSALYMACESGHADVVDYLLNFSVPVTHYDRSSKSDCSSDGTSDSSIMSGSSHEDTENVKPVCIDPSEENLINMNPGDSVIYRRESISRSCVYIAVKNRHLQIVEKLAEHGAKLDLTGKEDSEEYSVLLKVALDNNDLLMLNKLLDLNVQDLNNHVFEDAVRKNPVFVAHFLKYKASEDTGNHINKKLMKKEYRMSAGIDQSEKLSTSDPRYAKIFPTEAVNLRWQNLKVLSTVEASWITTAVHMFNPALSNMSPRVPMFAVTRVDVSNNCLTMIPTALLQLPSLCTLVASQNKIADFPSLANFNLDCHFLEEVYIQNNVLKTIPDYIFTLPRLRVLNANHNQINRLPACMWASTSLKTLDLSNNCITDLPRPLNNVRLESDTSVGPESIEESISMEHDTDQSSSTDSLVIYHTVKRANHWSDSLAINDEAVKASEDLNKGLRTLKLGSNKLTVFPDFLSCCCPQLEYLEMQKNELKALGNLGAYPKHLKGLDLSHNKIESMSDWQVEDDRKRCYLVDRRTSVAISGAFNPASTLSATCPHRNHSKLEDLDTLDLAGNYLTTLVVLRSSNITQSTELEKSLQERENKEKDIQGRLLFPTLTCLHLDKNSFTQLTDDIKDMMTLKILTLKQNTKLKELPPVLGLLDKLQRIEVDMCPLEGPIQDVIRGGSNKASDIIGFLRSVLEESENYNCMNLMIVGSFNIGKTSLLQQLMRKGKSSLPMMHYNQRQDSTAPGFMKDGRPLSTVGIDIGQLILDGKHGPVEFRTWDFAGQTEYYATHQYFLSPRSLYLVVWNLTNGEPGVDGLRQWLVNIQAQAPGAPVVIVGTHLDEVQKNKKYTRDWEASFTQMIRGKYFRIDNENVGLPKVIDIVNVSATKKGTHIEKLHRVIYEKVFTLNHPSRKSEKLLGHKVPKKYMKLQSVISDIVRMRKNNNKEPVLNANEYLLMVMEEMSKDESLTSFRNKEDLNQATRFLHENGVLCHFEDLALRDQYFLEPQWLCDQLARVVSINEVQKFCKNGVMKLKDMYQQYKDSDRIGQYILSLLSKFEVALQFDGEHLLLPSLLPQYSHLTPENMQEIPLKRKGTQAMKDPTVQSISSLNNLFGASMISFPVELSYICSEPHSNPAFSNTRLYLLTYFPSGFWPRLITRILADESFYEPALRMFQFPQEIVEKCPAVQRESPKWRCWQTGFELVYFGNVIMQVKEVRDIDYATGMCNYNAEGLSMECFFDSVWGELDIKDSVILEITFKADKLTFSFGHSQHLGRSGYGSIERRDIYHDEKAKTAILARTVEHIDGLLQDWFPEIGEARFIQSMQGRYLITRVVPCPQCLQAEIQHQQGAKGQWEMLSSQIGNGDRQFLSISCDSESSVHQGNVRNPADVEIQLKNRSMCTFLVERCIQNVLEGRDEICKIHGSVSPKCMPTQDGVIRILHIAPDAVFQDLDESFVVEDDAVFVTQRLGQGAFGTVSKAKLRRGENSVFDVAVKVLYDPSKDRKKTNQTAQICLETICAAYTTARQEVSILQTVEHPHIVPLLGLSRRPLALLLSLAPLGSLHAIFEDRHKDGLLLPVWVVKQVIIQVADALDYLHRRSIIYRDLKADNVLAWNIPGPNDLDPRQPVLVKLADYGISKSVLPGGTKGFGGTPPFIAPEILMHTGRDTYTEKVDIFSFGMFLFELLTCRQPLADISNINVHVVHGGRPSLTTEEAVYPSHMLDLLNICWDHNPENRPSAAQIRLIASSPQFCHLCDAVTMESEWPVLSACSVFVENIDSPETKRNSEDHSQVWMISSDRQTRLDVLSFGTNNKCTLNHEIKHDKMMMALCTVNRDIWCLDKDGVIHIYSPSRLEKIDEIQLPVHHSVEVVNSMSYHPDCGRYLVIILKESTSRSSSIFCCTDTMLRSHDSVQPIAVAGSVFCGAVTTSDNGCKLWHGGRDSTVYVRNVNQLKEEPRCRNVYEVHVTNQPCRFIATSVNMPDCHSVWTYNYPGSKVFRWDTDEEKVVASLDCSNKIPATDSCFTQKQNKKYEANHYQVTTLSAIGRYLYVGTTWGCVLVADALTMNAYSVFRCHGEEEFYCKAILHIGPRNFTPAQYEDGKLSQSFRRRTLVKQNSVSKRDNGDSILKLKNQGVVTVGRGYVDIIKYVTRLEKQALVRQDTADGWSVVDTGSAAADEREVSRAAKMDTFLLSWEPENWEFY